MTSTTSTLRMRRMAGPLSFVSGAPQILHDAAVAAKPYAAPSLSFSAGSGRGRSRYGAGRAPDAACCQRREAIEKGPHRSRGWGPAQEIDGRRLVLLFALDQVHRMRAVARVAPRAAVLRGAWIIVEQAPGRLAGGQRPRQNQSRALAVYVLAFRGDALWCWSLAAVGIVVNAHAER